VIAGVACETLMVVVAVAEVSSTGSLGVKVAVSVCRPTLRILPAAGV
jgi:hypothetical protein